MGNCQAVDAATLVIQHPNGKQERMYWSVKASEVMQMNPGHYVSLIIPLPDRVPENDDKTVRFTQVKLLRPSDMLVLGRAYRLVTTQEVMKVLRAKKHARTRKNQLELGQNLQMTSENRSSCEAGKATLEKNNQGIRIDRHQRRSGSTNSTSGRFNVWRPSLQSISESGS